MVHPLEILMVAGQAPRKISPDSDTKFSWHGLGSDLVLTLMMSSISGTSSCTPFKDSSSAMATP